MTDSRFRHTIPAAFIALTAILIVLPGLGAFGLWPSEVGLAERAAATVRGGGAPTPAATERLVAWGLAAFGRSEAGARLPSALLALGQLALLTWTATRLFGRRAGILATLVQLGFPLFILQARHISADLPVSFGFALALAGVSLTISSYDGRHRSRPAAGGLVALGGLAIAAATGGALVGLLPLLLGAAVAFWLARSGSVADITAGDVPSDSPRATESADDQLTEAPKSTSEGAPEIASPSSWAAASPPEGEAWKSTSVGVGLSVLAVGVGVLVAVVPQRAGVASWLLGGVPRGTVPTQTFDVVAEALGFGLFPLGAVALFAFFGLALQTRTARRFAVLMALFTTVFGIGLAVFAQHLVGQLRLVVLPLVALALGGWLDRCVARADRADAGGNPLLAFVAAASAILVARDITVAPEAFASVHLPAKITWPDDVSVKNLALVAGALAALGLAALLLDIGRWLPARFRGERSALLLRWAPLALVLGPGLILSISLAHKVVPALSQHLSSKALVDTYRRLATETPTPPLGLYQVASNEAGVFTPPPTVAIQSIPEIVNRLRAPGPLWMLLPRTELPAIDVTLAEAGVPFAIADASSSRHVLLAKSLPAGTPDRNPLRSAVWHSTSAAKTEKPTWVQSHPTQPATFGGFVELVGAEFPARAKIGGALTLALVFRVIGRVPAGHKIFVHLERAGDPLLNGDHTPLAGTFPTEHWRPGDYIRDEHAVDLPRVTTNAGTYRLSAGFWPGGDTPRIPITAGNNDGNNRAHLGTVEIK